MTVKLDWPPEMVSRLRDEAREQGLSLDAYLLQAVEGKVAHSTSEESSQKAREEAGRSIRALRKGNILGPDGAIRELIDEGRRF